MASSRIVGLNQQIATYGGAGAGRGYTSLATWESDTDNNLPSLTQSPVLECYADSAIFNDNITMSGTITSSSYFRIIRPATGQKHNGTSSTGVHIRHTLTAGHCFNINEDNSSVQDMIATIDLNNTSTLYAFRLGGNSCSTIGCIVASATNIGTGSGGSFLVQTGANQKVINCLASNGDNAGGGGFFIFSNSILYNCTSVDNAGAGFLVSSGTVTAKNCLAHNNTGNDFSGTFSSNSNNASEDGTATGTSSRTSQTFTFVNAGSDNWHLASNDTGALGFGANLSADGTFAFDDDIDGETITTWSIGFDSRVSTSVAKAARYYYAQR